MQFGASTWLWTSPFTSDDVQLLQKIAHMGFDFVEIPVEDPEHIDAAKLRPVLQDLGLEAIICTAVVGDRDLSSADPDVVNKALDYFGGCLALAENLGSGVLVGPLYAPVAKPRLATEALRRAEWERSATNLHRLATMAGERGIHLGLEPLNRFETDMVCTVADAKRMLADVNHPHLAIALDSFHMNIEEADFCAAVKQAGEQLVHVQVSESHRGVPGDGNSDWAGLREGLKAVGYDGKVSIESFSPDASSLAEAVCIWRRFASSQDEFARRGLEFLRRWSAQA
ncbi:sugar phosphate isomerase/epimerase family protein [Gilvimarinus xylanilyticus]|uniref:Sugar phosphate isomerase/epimerase n=1 Tax=Gilvimarinus xylanilyticus TaxID=2944139 RepID=A0A9X2HXX9_9GAMM|nr:sugar phosphate isomerase/epimerase [Gilvimarinus xylanilyticus]MCP8899094.1 sugar phosphate isomerase/epimerase [Gilvimarinus xylanilyticus]